MRHKVKEAPYLESGCVAKKAELIIYFQFVFIIRRIRLVVRTRDSQSRNRGSIPLCATKNSRDEG